MKIEPAEPVDFEWAQDEVAPEWDRLTDADGVVALAPVGIQEHVRVGMATFRAGELTWLWVDQWQGEKGIATALLEAIPGPLRVTITNADLHLLRWLQRRGWRITGCTPMAHTRPRTRRESIEVRDDIVLARLG